MHWYYTDMYVDYSIYGNNPLLWTLIYVSRISSSFFVTKEPLLAKVDPEVNIDRFENLFRDKSVPIFYTFVIFQRVVSLVYKTDFNITLLYFP